MIDAIVRGRPKLRALLERGARSVLDAVETGDAAGAEADSNPAGSANGAGAPPSEPAPTTAVSAEELQRAIGWERLSGETFRATARLYERLSEADVAEIEKLIAADPELAAHYQATSDATARQHLILAYGVWHGYPATTEKTGLSAAQPPEDVHVMARGALAAAGGLYEADLVSDALASVGVDIATLSAGLDFGCSSGRVVRVLEAAYPAISWSGCDPNEAAIDWATATLPEVDFFLGPHAPPLPLPDASLDLVYAISIWSHFAPALGATWFAEMHRVIRPGGHLICTTHGLTSVSHYATGEMRTPEQSREILERLYREGAWYAPEFGEDGDWGVINPDWGTAFLTPEWMLSQLCPQWQVLEFARGRNQENQDVYVLRRA